MWTLRGRDNKGNKGEMVRGLILIGFASIASSFTLMPPSKQRIDYLSGIVFYERWRDSLFLGFDSIISLKHYLSKLIRESALEVWQSRIREELRSQEGKGLGEGLFGPITIPTLGTESKIDISGGDEIHFGGTQQIHTGKGYQGEEALGMMKWFPSLNMKQKLNVNLEGSIGNRIFTGINYNSERMIQAENQVRLQYKGGEDDIVREIDLGNTQLPIPTSGYIGTLPTHKGLFGASAKAQLGGINIYTVLSQEQASSQTQTFKGHAQVTTDTIYDSQFEHRRFFYIPVPPGETIDPDNFYVYEDERTDLEQDKKRPGLAVLNPPDTSHTYPGDIDRGWFRRLESDKYVLDARNAILELKEELPSGTQPWVLAVIYRTKEGTWVGDTAWGANKDSLLLQLITSPTPSPESELWDLEIKNVYRIAPPNTKVDTIRIYKKKVGTQDEESENGETYLKILGLDPDGDGKVVYPYYDMVRGYLIFPDPYPFASPSLSEPDSIIYEKTSLDPGEGDKYYILVKSSSFSETFELDAMEIIEGSEKVKLNGQTLKRDVDYTINYQTGTVTFKRPILPNDEIEITYSTHELFSMFRRSLAGTRAEWDIFGNGKMGAGIFYRSVGIGGEEKAQVGLEPYSRLIGEYDLAYDIQPMFITRMIDKLPLISTDVPSSIHLFTEAGVSIPNPNTMGVAYVEDFEAQGRSADIGLVLPQWSWASVPEGKDTSSFAKTPLLWYNPKGDEVLKKGQVYLNTLEPQEPLPTYLKIIFKPSDTSTWAGIMSGLDPPIDISHAQYLEVVIRSHSGKGNLHIDFGSSIKKDAPRRDKGGNIVGYNDSLDTEDRNHDGVLDSDEDTGLDGVYGKDSEWSSISGDDGNDDYDLNTNPNGMENNGVLNTEDLNHTGVIGSNNYYSLEVSLDTSHYLTDLLNGFKLLQIPLTDTISIIKKGNPDSSRISLIRVWFDGFDREDTIELISLSFKGSDWRNLGVSKIDSAAPEVDTTEKVEVSQVSQEIDSTYTSPFKVSTYKRTPMGEEREVEASLQIKYMDIKPKHQITLCRYTFSRDDYREYKTLRIYLHNDSNNPVAFLRIGTDSLNYYEYSSHINEGRYIKPDWYEFVIYLDTFPPLKEDTLKKVSNYSVKGEPSLSSISYISIGLKNTSNSRISGKIWFNDIRLTDPRKEIGVGFHTQARLSLADLGSFYYDESRNDPNFKTFSSPPGVGTGTFTNQRTIQTSLNLHKFLPKSWGFNIPLSYNQNQTRSRPKYSPFVNDELLSEEEAKREEGFSQSRSFNVSLSKGRSENKILNYTLDALGFSASQQRVKSSTSLEQSSSSSDVSQFSYSINPNLGINLFNRRISYFPQSIQLSLSRSKGYGNRRTRVHPDSGFKQIQADTTNALSQSISLTYSPISPYLSTGFNLSQNRDLREPHFLKGIKIGKEASRNQGVNASLSIPLGSFLTPQLSYSGGFTLNSPREMDSLANVGNTRRFSASTRIGIGAPLRFFTKLFAPKGDSIKKPSEGFAKTLQEAAKFLHPISLSFTENRSSNYQGITHRPGFIYQIGLTDSVSDTLSFSGSKNCQRSYSLSSGMDIKMISLTTNFNHTVSQGSYLSSNTQNTSTTWPDLDLSISRIEALLGPWAIRSRVNSDINITNSQSGIVGKPPERVVKSLTFSPLLSWQTTWKRDISTELSLSYSIIKSHLPNSITQEENKGGGFSLGYSFSAPTGINFPGLRKIRFKSNLNLNLNLKYNHTQSIIYPEGRYERNYDTFDSNIQGSYDFSSTVTGGFTLGYNLLYDKKQEEKTHNTDLEFWVHFRF